MTCSRSSKYIKKDIQPGPGRPHRGCGCQPQLPAWKGTYCKKQKISFIEQIDRICKRPIISFFYPSQQCPAVMTLLDPTMEPPHIREPPTPRVSMICVMMMMMIMKVKMMVMMMLTSPLLIYCWTDDIQKRRFICDCSGLGNRMTQFCFKNSCGFSMRPGEGTLPDKHQCLPRSCRHLWPGGSRGPS